MLIALFTLHKSHLSGTIFEVHDDSAGKGKKGKSSPKKQKAPSKPKGRLVECGECEGCLQKACKKCDKCRSKKRCINRTCANMRRVEKKDAKKSPSRSKRSTPKKDDEGSEDDTDTPEVRNKPRIRIRVSAAKAAAASADSDKKEGKKRRATPQKSEGGNARKRSRRSTPRSSPNSSDDDEEENEMFDVDKIQSEFDELDDSFVSARQNFVQRGKWQIHTVHTRSTPSLTFYCLFVGNITYAGPWTLPSQIKKNFKEVAKITLVNISK